MRQFWTSRAWSDANGDFFTRNILTFRGPIDDPEAARANLFDPHAVDVPWPTLAQVERWDTQNDYPGQSPAAVERLEMCLHAAIRRVAGRCHLPIREVDAGGQVVPEGVVLIPVDVALAVVMMTVRYARRAGTPDGIAGTAELVGAIRTTAIDPDIEALLAPHIHLGLA